MCGLVYCSPCPHTHSYIHTHTTSSPVQLKVWKKAWLTLSVFIFTKTAFVIIVWTLARLCKLIVQRMLKKKSNTKVMCETKANIHAHDRHCIHTYKHPRIPTYPRMQHSNIKRLQKLAPLQHKFAVWIGDIIWYARPNYFNKTKIHLDNLKTVQLVP